MGGHAHDAAAALDAAARKPGMRSDAGWAEGPASQAGTPNKPLLISLRAGRWHQWQGWAAWQTHSIGQARQEMNVWLTAGSMDTSTSEGMSLRSASSRFCGTR